MNFSIWLGATFPEIPPEITLEAIGVVIAPEGLVEVLKARSPDKQAFELRELQDIVGGHIQVVPFNYGYIVCDEDGKSKRAPINKVATVRLKKLLRRGDFLVGDVLVCKKEVIA